MAKRKQPASNKGGFKGGAKPHTSYNVYISRRPPRQPGR